LVAAGGPRGWGHEFDIVTTNATLREMEAQALDDYLQVIGRSLATRRHDDLPMPRRGAHHAKEAPACQLYKAGLRTLTYIEQSGLKVLTNLLTGETFQLFLP